MTDFKSILKRYEVIPNVDRPITDKELQSQLHQRQPVEIEPHDVSSVVRLNSTFLEVTDIHYGWRGVLVTGALAGSHISYLLVTAALGTIVQDWGDYIDNNAFGLIFGALLACILSLGLLVALFSMFFYESFRFTHFPIRFNRKNHMVYVFRRNGTVLSVPWDQVFFRLREPYSEGRDYVIEGYVLGKDRRTVQEIFPLGYKSSETYNMYLHWEYIRRYMEAGPAEVFDRTDFCLPIWNRRESPAFGFWRLLYNFSGNAIHQILMSPFCFLFALGRVIAVWTSRIPQWPKEVEGACAIEPNDPYARDWRMNEKPYLFFFGRKK